MEELPDPSTFIMIEHDCPSNSPGYGLGYGICVACQQRNSLSKYGRYLAPFTSQFIIESDDHASGRSKYKCIIEFQEIYHDIDICNNMIEIDNKYNEKCMEIGKHFVKDKVDHREMLDADRVMSNYIRLYREWEPPTKPALDLDIE